MEADKAYSTEAQKLIGRLLRLMRREYSDGCRGRIDIELAWQSFCRHTEELAKDEAFSLRQMVKKLAGYSSLPQRVRQGSLVLVGKALALLADQNKLRDTTPSTANTSSVSEAAMAEDSLNSIGTAYPTTASTTTSAVPMQEREADGIFLLTAEQRRLMSSAPTLYQLNTPIEKIRSIGRTKQAVFNNLGIYTLRDLLTNYPRRWEDRRHVQKIAELRPGAFEQIKAVIAESKNIVTTNRKRLLEVEVLDESGSLKLVWFNQPYLSAKLRPGVHIVAFGKVEYDRGPNLRMASPEFAEQSENSPSFGRLVPIYKLSAKLYQNYMHKLMFKLIPTCAQLMPETLPQELLAKYHFLPKPLATMYMHWPTDYDQLFKAQQRLAFEELFTLQLRVVHKRACRQNQQRNVFYNNLINIEGEFQKLLPFQLTGAQQRAIKEIAHDLSLNHPMNRMLQGDVGSGKTVIAAYAAFAAVRNGYQAAIMAPTEILAQQHYLKLCQLLEPSGLRICLLKGSLTKKKKQQIAEQLKAGKFDLAVGTHALIQEGIEFANLGLAVVDEQHKFGVLQRQALGRKSGTHLNCDVLLMTATPIPRTMSLTIYGDLELSKLDELPPGRQPIKSRCVPFQEANNAYKFIASQVEEGRQAYIVCPLINESDKLEASAAVQEAERLKEGVFKKYRVGLLHGKMKAAEKEAIMEQFRNGSFDILISTTVIEVGVDVGNATVILIQDANRFGMAQLHQLRGRIGRSQLQSYCLFLASSDSPSNRKLEAVARLSDGFEVAEEDLEIRGPGDYFGTRQSGFPELICADLLRDRHLLELAKQEAAIYADHYPLEEDLNQEESNEEQNYFCYRSINKSHE